MLLTGDTVKCYAAACELAKEQRTGSRHARAQDILVRERAEDHEDNVDESFVGRKDSTTIMIHDVSHKPRRSAGASAVSTDTEEGLL